MNSRHQWVLRSAAGLLVLLLAVGRLGLVHAQDASGSEPVKIRVEVTDGGFNGNPGDFTIEVEQGKLVEMTFAWAHVGYVEEEHVMVLAGYKLEWDQIDFYHREATVKFIADKPGTFDFKCDLDCDIHDYLQRGHLKVKSGGGGGGAAALTPTTLTVSPSSWVTGGETVTLMAVLKDAKGVPVPKAEVRFSLEAEFAGTKGQMNIGLAKTDANGVAFRDYKPTLAAQKQKITAQFEGGGVYGGSQQAIEIQEVGFPPPAYTTAPIGLERIRKGAPVVLVVVVLAVWATFGFILYQAFSIARIRTRR